MSIRNVFRDDAESDNPLIPLTLGILALTQPLWKALDETLDPLPDAVESNGSSTRETIRYGLLGLLAVSRRIGLLVLHLPNPPVPKRSAAIPTGLLR